MEQGTGKTFLAFMFMVARFRKGQIRRAVFFCPVSVKSTIAYEARKHLADCKIYSFDSKTQEGTIPDAHLYIVGTESLSGFGRAYYAVTPLLTHDCMVVLDEAHMIANHTQRTQRLIQATRQTRYRLELTGTPHEEGAKGLFYPMFFLDMRILGYQSWYSFAANHLEYSERYPDMVVNSHNTEHLAAKMRPYIYQVTKADCLDLPDVEERNIWFDMSQQQQEAYAQAKSDFLLDVDPNDWHPHDLFRLFSALQQIVCGHWRLKGKLYELENPRLDAMMEKVQAIDQDEPVIIWAKYHYDIREIVSRLHVGGYSPEDITVFTGEKNEREKDEALVRFHGGAKFFVGTYTGSMGLTLNEAAHMIFYSYTFSARPRLQAEDRNHRIGQDRTTHRYFLACNDSIDERIMQAIADKTCWAAQMRQQIRAAKDMASLRQIVAAA